LLSHVYTLLVKAADGFWLREQQLSRRNHSLTVFAGKGPERPEDRQGGLNWGGLGTQRGDGTITLPGGAHGSAGRLPAPSNPSAIKPADTAPMKMLARPFTSLMVAARCIPRV
jgi:hypothetical protein